jgi:hypothetical protein
LFSLFAKASNLVSSEQKIIEFLGSTQNNIPAKYILSTYYACLFPFVFIIETIELVCLSVRFPIQGQSRTENPPVQHIFCGQSTSLLDFFDLSVLLTSTCFKGVFGEKREVPSLLFRTWVPIKGYLLV